jgi:hypothetical protein
MADQRGPCRTWRPAGGGNGHTAQRQPPVRWPCVRLPTAGSASSHGPRCTSDPAAGDLTQSHTPQQFTIRIIRSSHQKKSMNSQDKLQPNKELTDETDRREEPQ